MNNKLFDIEFDESGDIIQEGSVKDPMDFDDDDDEVIDDDKLSPDQVDEFYGKLKDELGQDDTSSENVEADADKEAAARDYEQKYLERLKSERDPDPLQQLEMAVNSKLPKDFAEGVFIFDNNDFANAKIDKDGKVIFYVEGMFPLKRIISERRADNYHLEDDKLFAIGSDGFGNAIVVNTEDWCYYIWYHDTKGKVLIAKAFSNEGINPDYNITENDTLLGKLGYTEPTESNTDDTTTTETETTEEPKEESTPESDINDEFSAEAEEDVHLEAVAPAEPTVIRTMWEPNKLKNMKYKDAMSSKENIVLGLKAQNKFFMKVEKLDKSYVDEIQSVEEKAVNTLIDKGYIFIGSYGDGSRKHTLRWVYVPKTWFDGSTDNYARCLCCEVLKNSAGEKSMHIFGEAFDHDGKLISTEELYNKPFNHQEQATQESFVQESDDETVGDALKSETTEGEEPRTDETIEEDMDIDLDMDFDLGDSETPEGDDLKDFGTDTSDIQNEYDPKEIEILNKLIAAEAEAVNDYFDASKDSHDSNARRLYSDIGHEERFHMEQLLFQKAQFTGEKYEPRDPEVKKEYEELLQMGMDDETAMQTAVNKVSSPEDNESEFVEYMSAATDKIIEQSLFIMETAKYMWDRRADKTIRDCSTVMESFFYQEEMINMGSSQVKKEVKQDGLLKMISKAFRTMINSLSALTSKIRDKEEAMRLRNKRRREWIQKNGWEGIFKGGRSFYFYSPKDDAFNMVYPCQYIDLLYRLSIDIGKKCGVSPTASGYRGTIKNPIKYSSIEDGMAKIKNLKPEPTKVVITDKNKDAMLNELFGYSDRKVSVAMWNAEANAALYASNNVYNKLVAFQAISNEYARISNSVFEVMDNLQNNPNSIAWKDKLTYNKYMKYMSEIATAYTKLIDAARKDIATMESLPDAPDVKETTLSRDMGNKLPEGAPDRRTSGSNGNNASSNKYAKSKK